MRGLCSIKVRVHGMQFREADLDVASKLGIARMRLAQDSSLLSHMRTRKYYSDDPQVSALRANTSLKIERLYSGSTCSIDNSKAMRSIDPNNGYLDFEISGIVPPPSPNGNEQRCFHLMRIIRSKLEGRCANMPFFKEGDPCSLVVRAVIDGNSRPKIKTPDSVYRDEEMISAYEKDSKLPDLDGFEFYDFDKARYFLSAAGFWYKSDYPEKEDLYFLMQKVNVALRALSPQELDIIQNIYWVFNYPTREDERLTSKALGEKYGLSVERIRQDKEKAMSFLRSLNYTRNNTLHLD